MKKKNIVIAMLVLLLNAYYSEVSGETIVLLDMSQSVFKESDRESPFNANLKVLHEILRNTGKSDTVTVLGFGRKSDVVLLKATMPRQSGPMNKNLIATRQAAVKKLQENLQSKAKHIDGSRTDVIGGLYRACRLFEEADMKEGDHKTLYILSDLLDTESLGMSLKNMTGDNKTVIRNIEKRITDYPDLKGVEIHVFSNFTDVQGLSTVGTEIAVMNLKNFWKVYFDKTGSYIKTYRTSY